MKTLNFIAVFILFVNISFSQNQYSPAVEIFVGTEGAVPQSKNITFYLTKCGPVFGDQSDIGVKYYYVTNNYDYSSYIPLTNNNSLSSWAGWDFVFSQTYNPPDYPVFGFGIYRFSTDDGSNSFFIDYRDTRYGTYHGSTGHNADIWIKYNDPTNTFYYSSYGDTNSFNQIGNNDYLTIWSIKGQGTPSRALFVDSWLNCLAIIASSDNHPRLIWFEYPESVDVVSYKIWRKYGSQNWAVLYTTPDPNTFSYIDESVTISSIQSGTTVQYKVTALYNIESESPPTNTVSTHVSGGEIEKQNPVISKPSDFSLSSNYPNPFNPSTKIAYSIKEEGSVVLKVYDVLGKEVATLVNENKPEGIYETELDASSLPSGLYIYKLQAGSFSDVKKMLLLK